MAFYADPGFTNLQSARHIDIPKKTVAKRRVEEDELRQACFWRCFFIKNVSTFVILEDKQQTIPMQFCPTRWQTDTLWHWHGLLIEIRGQISRVYMKPFQSFIFGMAFHISARLALWKNSTFPGLEMIRQYKFKRISIFVWPKGLRTKLRVRIM